MSMRAFSVVKRLFTHIRLTITEKMLNNCMIIHIHKDLNEEAGYKREGNSPNFCDFSRLATATNIVLPLY